MFAFISFAFGIIEKIITKTDVKELTTDVFF